MNTTSVRVVDAANELGVKAADLLKRLDDVDSPPFRGEDGALRITAEQLEVLRGEVRR